MTPDEKWLGIVKDSDVQLCMTAACGLFLFGSRAQWFPLPPDWVLQIAWFGLFLFGALSVLKIIAPLLFLLIEVVFLKFGQRRK